MLACLAATLSYAFSANFSRRRLSQASPLAVATGGHAVSALLLAGPALLYWPAQAPSARAWAAVLALAVGCTALAYVLYYRLIARIGATRTVAVAYLILLFGLLWGALFLDERFGVEMAAGCGVILLGVALATGLVQPGRRRVTAPAR